jgi:hypothetical protein
MSRENIGPEVRDPNEEAKLDGWAGMACIFKDRPGERESIPRVHYDVATEARDEPPVQL